jgi:hypothetical protein
MGAELSGQTVGALLVGVTILLTFLVSQTSTKAREQRRRLRELGKRDIAAADWIHKVQVWAASHGYHDLPRVPAVLSNDDEDEA